MDEKIICKNIKKLRKQNHFTLEKLATLTGLTKGYLSKVERSEKAPPYSTLNKIAGALGIEVTSIFGKNSEPLNDIRISFQKKDEGTIIKATSQLSGYDYEVLGASKPGKNMEPFIIYSPWEITKMYSHEGEEFMYVMEGRLEFLYGDKTYIMEKGDNVYFDSCIPHSGKSLGDKKAVLLVVIYFYKRNRQ
ncbi:MAG: XRE family transcriptional regulator [Proteobacteria bacterium]|nr:XRE family transcriptional regulator [Pseudomonadota bacterium]MBU1584901.1 XRE family transcriptional regulator [Pseudomonadota bacterium]MBU2454888.1 XRE family transcriptional regulator [Pseudomonadota bacterium]MBU2630933.1 XRE family transcriptional regulator [Pseudomonadota bacterium]